MHSQTVILIVCYVAQICEAMNVVGIKQTKTSNIAAGRLKMRER